MAQISAKSIDFNSVLYAQEYLYPYFSNGKMSISETYVALANGFLDPASLAPIRIFKVGTNLYCSDTRRLKIVKELERRNKRDVLKHFPIQYVQKDDEDYMNQYSDLVDRRIPAMRRKGLDGTTIQLDRNPNDACCFDEMGNCRDDLDQHIAEKHLKMRLSNFKSLNTYECDDCDEKACVIAEKEQGSGCYSFFQQCACGRSELWISRGMEKPWTEVTFSEFCNEFVTLKETFGRLNGSQNTIVQSVLKGQSTEQTHHPQSSSNINADPTRMVKSNGLMTRFYILMLVGVLMGILIWLSPIFLK